jgi:hypothetical protein
MLVLSCKGDNDYCAQENANQAMNEIHESILIVPPEVSRTHTISVTSERDLQKSASITVGLWKLTMLNATAGSNASYLTGNELSKKRLSIWPLSMAFEVFEVSLGK